MRGTTARYAVFRSFVEHRSVELDRELEQYVRLLLQGMGRTERLQALGLYATGLLLSGERKSIAPMAARLSDSAAEADAMR